MAWIAKTATMGGKKIVYLDGGDPRATNVVALVHAFPVGMRMWEPTTIPAGWRALAAALPGFDGADLPPGDSTSIDDYATHVLALLDHEHVTRAVIGGVSMGGYVAFALWRLAASRIRGLVLADTKAGADAEPAKAGRQKMLELVSHGGSHAVADEMIAKLLGETTRASRPEVVDAVWRFIERQTSDAITYALVRLRDRPDATPLLPAITPPVLVAVGEEDTLTPPAESERMHAALPNARLVRIPQAGHLASMENPAAFNAALAAFLNEECR